MINRLTTLIRKSFSAKIITLVVANVVITSLIICIVTMRSTERFLISEISEKFPSILLNSRGKIELWYFTRTLDMTVLSKSESFLKNIAACLESDTEKAKRQPMLEISKYFHYVKEQFPVYEDFVILGPKREIVAKTVEIDPEDADLLKTLSAENEGETALSEAILTADRSTIYQWLLVPIEISKEKSVTICSRLEIKELASILSEVPMLPEGDLYLLDFRGCFVTQPRMVKDKNMLGVKAMEVPTRQEKPVTVEKYSNYAGNKVLGSKVSLPEWNWWLICEEDYKTAMSPVSVTRKRIIFADFIILLIFIIAALRIVRPILRPIRALADGAKKIKDGMVGVHVDAVSDDEIGLMIHTFNEMAKEIGIGRVKLQAKNKELNARNEDLQVLNKKLEELSITDGLTGLYNHRHFWNLLHNEMSRIDRTKGDLSIILMDIDDFKNVNDRFGHSVGDVLLQSFADMVKNSVRTTDIVARYGGEEFAVMLPGTNKKGALHVAEKIRIAIEKMVFKVPETDITLSMTASIGVSVYRGDRREFFNAADQALYLSKNKGKNCVSFAEQVS